MDRDWQLLESIVRGDEQALRALIEGHKDALFRYVFRWVRNEADAEEIVSETFVRVYQNAGRFRPSGTVKAWVYSIATNLCRDRHRRLSRWKVLSIFAPVSGREGEEGGTEVNRMESKGLSAGDRLELTERYQAVLHSIEALPERLRTPFILHILEELPQRECAEILGVSEKTVETRVYRARKRLKKAMG